MNELSVSQRAKFFDHTYREDFKYKHRNPYHDKLKIFEEFVLRDEETEKLKNNWNKYFDNENPLDIEIGTGYGHFMIDYSKDHPNRNFVGLDYRFKRSFNLARRLSSLPFRNFRYLRAKGERISFSFGENEVDRIFYFFPDPWPKKRHHKKRLFQQPFLNDCRKLLRPGGRLFVKTDHHEYFEWMMEIVSGYQQKDSGKVLSLKEFSWDLYGDLSGEFEIVRDYKTKFEKIFLKQEKPIKAAIFECSIVN